ncbi:MAG: transporter [Clostridia bacterium]|nr:transporter [Clostridia bacterium]
MSETNVSTRTSTRARASTNKKPKVNQIPFGIAMFVGIIAFGIYLSTITPKLALFWILGCCFGFILQKSRFCFTASLRDPYLTGSTSVTRAVLIAFAITTIGFTAIKYGAFLRGLPIPGQSYIVPISFATAAGAFLFGIGMVIAGGCASGTLMRVGEGFGMQMLSLLFFVIGSLWGAHDFGWWKLNFMLKGTKIFLPDIFGWGGAIAVQLLVIAGLYILADKWENRKLNGETNH